MKYLYWSFVYILGAWALLLSQLHFSAGVRIYAWDILLLILLIPCLLRLVLASRPSRPVRLFLLYELIVLVLVAYSFQIMGNPPNSVLGQARVFGFYSTTFLVSYVVIGRAQDLRSLKRVGVLIVVTLLAIVTVRLVTGVGYAEEEFGSNVNDVSRFLSYYEACVISVFYFWFLVRWSGRRLVRSTWKTVLLVLVVGALHRSFPNDSIVIYRV